MQQTEMGDVVAVKTRVAGLLSIQARCCGNGGCLGGE